MVRPATLDDLPRLIEMGQEFVEQTGYQQILKPPSPDLLAQLATYIIENPLALGLVSEIDGVVQGMFGMVLTPHPMTGELVAGEVVWWMNPEVRIDGVKMLQVAERWANEHGAAVIQMIAPTRRVEMFYERMGYQPVERAYQKRINGEIH